MKIVTVRRPGQPGTLKLQRKYGDRLVCVRYRYDKQRAIRQKTIELVIEEQVYAGAFRYTAPSKSPTVASTPDRPDQAAQKRQTGGRASSAGSIADPLKQLPVLVKIGHDEIRLREIVRGNGGQWMPASKTWKLSLEVAVRLGLQDRIQVDV